MVPDDVPLDVRRGIAGLWVVAMLSIFTVQITVGASADAPGWEAPTFYLVMRLACAAVAAVIAVVFTRAIERRKRWSRRVLTVLLVVSMAIDTPHLNANLASTLSGLLTLLKVYVLFCLYCPAARSWFAGTRPTASA